QPVTVCQPVAKDRERQGTGLVLPLSIIWDSLLPKSLGLLLGREEDHRHPSPGESEVRPFKVVIMPPDEDNGLEAKFPVRGKHLRFVHRLTSPSAGPAAARPRPGPCTGSPPCGRGIFVDGSGGCGRPRGSCQ